MQMMFEFTDVNNDRKLNKNEFFKFIKNFDTIIKDKEL